MGNRRYSSSAGAEGGTSGKSEQGWFVLLCCPTRTGTGGAAPGNKQHLEKTGLTATGTSDGSSEKGS